MSTTQIVCIVTYGVYLKSFWFNLLLNTIESDVPQILSDGKCPSNCIWWKMEIKKGTHFLNKNQLEGVGVKKRI